MLVALHAGLLPTSAALAVLHMISAQPGRAAEVTVLLIANLAGRCDPVRLLLTPGVPPQGRRASLAWLFRLGAVNSWRCPFSARLAMLASRAVAAFAGDVGGLFPLMGPSEAARRTFTTPPGSLLLCIRRHRRRTYRRRQR